MLSMQNLQSIHVASKIHNNLYYVPKPLKNYLVINSLMIGENITVVRL